MFFFSFTVLTVIEIFADTALVPNSNKREAITSIASHSAMGWLLFLFKLFYLRRGLF